MGTAHESTGQARNYTDSVAEWESSVTINKLKY